jgi:Zn-dependent protease/CBS domain-containing protein
VTVSLGAGVLPSWHPQWNPAVTWSTAVAAACLFFVSVLVHELSHALVARSRGVQVSRITLFVFGGVAHMSEEPHDWRSEFLIAVVGPVTSLVLGVACIALGSLTSGSVVFDAEEPSRALAMLNPFATLLFWLGPVNVILALFNLVPGFPLDGGRVLRAALWGVTGDLRRATRWAANGGQLVAWLLIVAGLSMALGLSVPVFGSGLTSGLWLALIGWFLNNAAVMSYRQVLLRESLDGVPVSKLMMTDIRTIGPETTVQSLVDDYVMSSEQRAFPVTRGGELVGLVCMRDVRKVARSEWQRTTAEDVMTKLVDLAVIAPEAPSAQALKMLGQRDVNQILVLDRGKVIGMVRRRDILRWLMLYGSPELDIERHLALQRGR